MSYGKVIYHLLSTNDAVSRLVNDRIYPLRIKQSETSISNISDESSSPLATESGELLFNIEGVQYPAITYSLISTDPVHVKNSAAVMANRNVDIDIWSSSYSNCQDIITAVLAALENQEGLIQGVNLLDIMWTDQEDEFDDAQEYYHTTLEFQITIMR